MKPSLIRPGLPWLSKVTVQPRECCATPWPVLSSWGTQHWSLIWEDPSPLLSHCPSMVQPEQQQMGINFICCSTRIATIPWVGSTKVRKRSCWTLMGQKRLFFFQAWTFRDRYISPPGSAFLGWFISLLNYLFDDASCLPSSCGYSLLFSQKKHLIRRDAYPGKITREKNWGEKMGLGILKKRLFFWHSQQCLPWKKRTEAFGETELCFFTCTVTAVCHFKGHGPHPHEAFIVLPKEAASGMLCGFWFLFYCWAIPAAHRSGNTALFSSRKDGLNPNTFPSHSYHTGRWK